MAGERESERPQAFDWLAMAATLALFVGDYFVERGNDEVLSALGAAALILAIVFIFPPFYLLRKHGRVEKGKPFFFTETVVDRGLYAIVRHPQYLGYILLVLGFSLRSQNLLTVAFGCAAIVLFYLQAVSEERFCSGQLGEEYEAYLGRVPRFNFVLGLVRYLGGRTRPQRPTT
jgi:protein-S-isoprenylcysteine O-methyltransferase Ste14